VNGAGKSVNSFFRNLLGLGEAIEDTPNFGGGGAGAGYGEVADEVDENTESQKKNNEESKKSIRSLATMKAELGRLQKSYEKLDVNSSAFTRTGKRIAELKDEIAKYEGRTKAAAVATEKFARDSIGFLQAQLSDLQTELTGAVSGSDQERSLIEDILGVEQAIEKLQDARVKIRNEIARLGDDITPVSILPETDAEIDQLSQTQSALERQTDEFQDRLNERIIENTKSREETVTRNTLHEAERRADSLQKILAIADEATGRIGNIATSLEQGVSARANQQINEIQARYAAEIEAAEGNADRQEELREQQVEAEREVRQKELEAAKKYQIAALLASSAAGVINILSAQSLIPQPLSSVFKAAQITALALSTAKQVKAIRSQTIAARGGIFEDEDVRPVSPRTRRRRRAERNYKVMQGWVRGQSHNGPGGGVPLTLNGHNVLAEDGEFIDYDENGNVIVINKRSAANHRKELNGMYGRSFRGKGVTLDHINRFRGFGRPIFDEGGIIEPPNLDGIALLNAQHNGTYAQVFGPQSESPQAELSDEAAAKIAAAAARAIYEAGRKGVADGAADANRRRERQERLDKRTGK
jgi:Icc-related predicted phosphoesterase